MPKDNLTTEQLMEAALRTVKQMSPGEKAKLRKQLERAMSREDVLIALGSGTVFRKDTHAKSVERLLRMPVSKWLN
jgi:hypothetical protein